MDKVILIPETVLPVAGLIALGALFRKNGFLQKSEVETLKKVVVNITLPCVLFKSYATMEMGIRIIPLTILVYLCCCLAYVLGRMVRGAAGSRGRLMGVLTTGFEAGMLGYTLYGMLYGGDSTGEFALLDLGQCLFVFTLYKFLLGMENKDRESPLVLIREMFASPIMLAMLGGIGAGLLKTAAGSGPGAGAYISTAISLLCIVADFVAAPTAVLILLSIGYELVFEKIPWTETIKAILCRYVIMAIIGLVMLGGMKLIGSSKGEMRGLTVLLLLPPPYILPVFAGEGEESIFVSSVITVSTLITIVGFVILAMV